jgi:glutaredoxin-like protein
MPQGWRIKTIFKEDRLMQLLDDKTRADVQKMLADLAGPARLVMFTQEVECDFCAETRQLVEEVAALSDDLSVEVHDFMADTEAVERYGIDKIPAIAIMGGDGQDYGVRYYGIPSGYEFTSLLHDILAVGAGPGAVGLSPDTLAALENLSKPVHLQVFVTPTCPYCPRAVLLAHAMAIVSDKVRADTVEATEYPHLAIKYSVMGVPRTVINEDHFVEGAAPEPMLLAKILEAVG